VINGIPINIDSILVIHGLDLNGLDKIDVLCFLLSYNQPSEDIGRDIQSWERMQATYRTNCPPMCSFSTCMRGFCLGYLPRGLCTTSQGSKPDEMAHMWFIPSIHIETKRFSSKHIVRTEN
jgi:hypothetical protein